MVRTRPRIDFRPRRTPSGTLCVRTGAWTLALALSLSAVGCASPGSGGGGTGGDQGSGGTVATGGSTGSGTGGTSATGGSTGSGGVIVTSTGGAKGTGGATSTGGSTGIGGSPGTGGSPGSGGSPGTGGAKGTGGATNTGGSTGTGGATGCAGTLTMCSGSCFDTTGSQNNCGACGKACRSDQTCWQSACICPTGQGDCGGSCKDVTASTTNCGTCGTACATGATCVTGVCQCPTNQIACSGACTNPTTDGKNCGSCGKVCGSGTSCLFGACLDPTSLACTPATQANKSSASGASITLGKYWINNNQWGASSGSGTQAIWSTCQQGDLIGWGTSWNWTGTTNKVKSYSSSVLGWQFGLKITNTGLPLALSSTSAVNCGWAYNFTQSGGSADVSYDTFVHTISNPTSSDNPSDEIMIWLYTTGGAAPTGTKQTSVTIDSATWDLYRGSTTWNVFSYVRQSNATTAVVNVMDFMKDLIARGWLQSSKYLTSVQSGTEIFTGTGELDTTGYYCRVQ